VQKSRQGCPLESPLSDYAGRCGRTVSILYGLCMGILLSKAAAGPACPSPVFADLSAQPCIVPLNCGILYLLHNNSEVCSHEYTGCDVCSTCCQGWLNSDDISARVVPSMNVRAESIHTEASGARTTRIVAPEGVLGMARLSRRAFRHHRLAFRPHRPALSLSRASNRTDSICAHCASYRTDSIYGEVRRRCSISPLNNTLLFP
jgi:hypothetical protein